MYVAVVISSAYKHQSANPRAVGADVLEPHLERKSYTTASKTVRRIVCGGEADLACKSFESSVEERRGNGSKTGGGREEEERIIGIGRH